MGASDKLQLPPAAPPESVDPKLAEGIREFGLEGRTLYLPQMPYGGSYLLAAAIRSIGLNAQVTTNSDERTLELGGRLTSGDECYPQKITMGDLLRMIEDQGRDKVAYLMPTANGPCRFGQYMHLIRTKLDELGYEDVPIITITSNDGYSSIGQYSMDLVRTAWRAVLCQDILMKALLKTRPYEREKGSADRLYLESLEEVGRAISAQYPGTKRSKLDALSVMDATHKQRLEAIVAAMTKARDRFRALPADYDSSRPLIGVVGEIFCRHNTFSNFDLIRAVEEQGGECWLAGIGEWVWYVDDEQRRRLEDEGRKYSKENGIRYLKTRIQLRDEHAIYGPWRDDFVGYEDPHSVRELLTRSEPYLPYTGALGEMVISTGSTVYLHEKGADGIIDISPFSCMNGIVTQAIYPVVQRDLDGLPIRVFYFDGTQGDLERDVGIFLELAHTYRRRKHKERRYPAYFPAGA